VLRVQNMQPGIFQAFSDPVHNRAFNEWFARMMNDLKWCCTTQLPELKEEGNIDSIRYPAPPELPALEPFKVRCSKRTPCGADGVQDMKCTVTRVLLRFQISVHGRAGAPACTYKCTFIRHRCSTGSDGSCRWTHLECPLTVATTE